MSIYQHFRHEELETVKVLEDLVTQAESQYAPILTHFLDPRQQFILTTLVNRTDLKVSFYGGNGERERVRALIYPEYYKVQREDFEVSAFKVKYAQKFVTLTHRNVLGALMQLGFKRDYLGDIITGEELQIVIAAHLGDYIEQHLTKLKGSSVKLIEISADALNDSVEIYQSHDATVSSLRLDNMIAEMIRKSRAIAQKHIEAGHVKVNHVIIDKVSFVVESGDTISIKGFGRAQLTEIGDVTKKNKYRITYKTLFNQ
ncbi:RNA-binding protein [Macrococcoides canis]|uniref:YlmH family RNA-binding protein n=1 Tax=Macrococcoides canis TaxID=1855823 RepID=UPI00105EA457|nr:RNA-binding protein [Macrococcus canis]MEE1106588.1 RNA-binding protein [Macrococcus canis]TDM21988.1 RNA-binding protein [Macrococcus canis]TDM24507.1 RNA-binding protein [Macrococcus canis]TDM43631.1 RNA-binding protein [Macrococcus canis]